VGSVTAAVVTAAVPRRAGGKGSRCAGQNSLVLGGGWRALWSSSWKLLKVSRMSPCSVLLVISVMRGGHSALPSAWRHIVAA